MGGIPTASGATLRIPAFGLPPLGAILPHSTELDKNPTAVGPYELVVTPTMGACPFVPG